MLTVIRHGHKRKIRADIKEGTRGDVGRPQREVRETSETSESRQKIQLESVAGELRSGAVGEKRQYGGSSRHEEWTRGDKKKKKEAEEDYLLLKDLCTADEIMSVL